LILKGRGFQPRRKRRKTNHGFSRWAFPFRHATFSSARFSPHDIPK